MFWLRNTTIIVNCAFLSRDLILAHMGLVTRKPVFRQRQSLPMTEMLLTLRFNPAFSASEYSKNSASLPAAS